ncbi:MAG: hypothetical protein Q7T03_03770 [Deltaproteobacteria bacterium]|nr:hypothetical protein [Deltaproteobacteria bacterium]
MRYSIKNKSGNAAVELVLIFPFIALFCVMFFQLFHRAIQKESELVQNDNEARQAIKKMEDSVPVLDRPCQVNKKICFGRNR